MKNPIQSLSQLEECTPIGNGIVCKGNSIQITKHIPNYTIDAILTDPPYGVLPGDEPHAFFIIEPILYNKCKKDCWFAFYYAKKTLPKAIRNIRYFKYHWLITIENVTHKKTRSPLGSSMTQIILLYKKGDPKIHYKIDDMLPGHDLPIYQRQDHPEHKPLIPWIMLITALTKPGDIILDPFAGSGSLAVAAELTGRRWIAIEKDPQKVEKTIQAILSLATLST